MMASYTSGLSDTGPSCNNVCALACSVPNLLITLHMPFVDDLIPSVLVWVHGQLACNLT
jgi:hypothetical protein